MLADYDTLRVAVVSILYGFKAAASYRFFPAVYSNQL
jgi:hypothetical protein